MFIIIIVSDIFPQILDLNQLLIILIGQKIDSGQKVDFNLGIVIHKKKGVKKTPLHILNLKKKCSKKGYLI